MRKKADAIGAPEAIVQIDPNGERCVPALISALKQEDSRVVAAAAEGLGLLGPRASDAVPALTAVLTRDFPAIWLDDPRVCAAKALARLGPRAKSAIPTLISQIGFEQVDGMKEYWSSVPALVRAIGRFGAEARAAVPSLIEIAQGTDKNEHNCDVRRAAILALGQIGPSAKAAIPTLCGVIQRDDSDASCLPEALVALCRLAPNGKGVAENWLNKSVGDRVDRNTPCDVESRAMVLGALGRSRFDADMFVYERLARRDSFFKHIGPLQADPISSLEEFLEFVGSLGPAARAAIPRVNEFLKHSNPWVRMWAVDALARIDPPAKWLSPEREG
jgi:HEAT repeat protein